MDIISNILTTSEHLKEEGRLREDINIEYDEREQPKSWEDLKEKVRGTFHPGLNEEVPVAKASEVKVSETKETSERK